MSVATLQQVWREGRLIRGKWSDTDEQGRQLLCLYTALAGHPEGRPGTCPANLCPRWIAYLLPWLDDAPSPAAWPGIVERIVLIAARLVEVPAEVEWRVRALCVRDAVRRSRRHDALGVCEKIAGLCEQRGRGVDIAPGEMVALLGMLPAPDRRQSAPWAALATAAWAATETASSAASTASAAQDGPGVTDRLAGAILAEIESSLEKRP